jgi:hypothetical protein
LINEDLKEQNKTISAENSRLLLLASKTASAESEGDSSDKYIRRIKDLEENLDEFRMREEMLLSQLEESKSKPDLLNFSLITNLKNMLITHQVMYTTID